MRILIVSDQGDGFALGLQFVREGHEVGLWGKDKLGKLYDGLCHAKFFGENPDDTTWQDIDKAIAWRPDYAICDVTGLTWFADQLRNNDIPVVGGNRIADLLEEERFDALELAHHNGVPIPLTIGFKEHETAKAIEFLKKCSKDEQYVLKSSRKDKASSFVAKHPEDIEPFMKEFPPMGPFVIQQKIEGIAEVNCEAWFSGGKPIGLYIGGMEQKKFLAGSRKSPRGLGQNTGCMSNLGWVWRDHNHPIIKAGFTKGILEIIAAIEYSGPLDMAFLIGKDEQPYFIEFTPRFGYDAIYDMLEYVDCEWGEFFWALANGRLPKFTPRPGFGCSIDISIAPYPQDNTKLNFKGEPVVLDESLVGHYHPGDVMIDKGRLVTAGTSGWLGVITGYGKTWFNAVNEARQRVESLEISDLQYRVDAGAQGKDIDMLRRLGWSIP